MKSLLFVPLFLLMSLKGWAAQPFLESVEGGEQVTVMRAGQPQNAIEGDELLEKDQVQTEDRVSARIAYPDGSTLILGAKSAVEIEAPQGGASSAKMLSGLVQAQVEKSSDDPHRPYKFFIRTNSAVMGVRGTQFVVNAGEETQLHTLDGTVDVAKDQGSLNGGQGAAVHANESVKASSAKGISPVEKFDRKQYLSQLRKNHPHLAKIARRAPLTTRAAVLERKAKAPKRRRGKDEESEKRHPHRRHGT